MALRTALFAVLIAASVPTAFAQHECNPLQNTCDPIPGFQYPLGVDFTVMDKLPDSYIVASYEQIWLGSNGVNFTLRNQNDAPYMWTESYLQYGTVEAVFQTAPGVGVISSIVLMSDDLDEIDWEFSGNNYGDSHPTVQTNYYGKGVTGSYNRGTQPHVPKEMTTNFITYTLDWTPDSLTWSMDGQVIRVLYAKDCTAGDMQYPQTPARVHVGVWDAGAPNTDPSTAQWAGGRTDLARFPYSAYLKTLKITPYKPCPAYRYKDKSGSSDSVECVSASLLPSSTTSTASSTATPAISATATTTNGHCAGDTGRTCLDSWFGVCCSAYGYCGTGPQYCGDGCQPGFGLCGDDAAQYSSTKNAASSTTSSLSSSTVSASSTTSPSSSSTPSSSTPTTSSISSTVSGTVSSTAPSSVATSSGILSSLSSMLLGTTTSQTASATSSTDPDASSTVGPCPQSNTTIYSGPSGGSFIIYCGIDYPFAATLGYVPVSTLERCIDACDANPQCLALSFIGSQGSSFGCYLKQNTGSYRPSRNNLVIAASRIKSATTVTPTSTPTAAASSNAPSSTVVSSSSASSTAASSTATSSAASSTATPSSSTLTATSSTPNSNTPAASSPSRLSHITGLSSALSIIDHGLSNPSSPGPTSAETSGFQTQTRPAMLTAPDPTASSLGSMMKPITAQMQSLLYTSSTPSSTPATSSKPSSPAATSSTPTKASSTKPSSTATVTSMLPQGCNQDNCLRNVLDPRYSSSAVGVCKTWMSTAATSIGGWTGPTDAVANCKGDVKRVSSACSCLGKVQTTASS